MGSKEKAPRSLPHSEYWRQRSVNHSWSSKEGNLKLHLVAVMHNQRVASLRQQNKPRHNDCPILRVSVNAESTIVGLANMLITDRSGQNHS